MTRLFRLLAVLAAALVAGGAALAAGPRRDMLAFDAVYIPALAATSAASQDASVAPRARATLDRLAAAWPALQPRLQAAWPGERAWTKELADVGGRIAEAGVEVRRGGFGAAHEALETVRLTLMAARQRHGMEYFVDALTEYHEPMEQLALAGSKLKPAQVDAAARARLEQAFTHARALWLAVERLPVDAGVLALTPRREAQLRTGIADESAALARLSVALRESDAAALLKAAGAIKPPFARAFTAFGLAEGEAALP